MSVSTRAQGSLITSANRNHVLGIFRIDLEMHAPVSGIHRVAQLWIERVLPRMERENAYRPESIQHARRVIERIESITKEEDDRA